MSFVFYPNHEHRCPNLMHCPHIGGAALGYVVSLANENDQRRDWLFRQLDGAREESAARWRRIVELEERVRQLEAELKAERQKQFKAARPEEERTSPEVSEGTEAKKRGAPVGHPGWSRATPTKIDRTIQVAAPASCAYCGAAVLALPHLPPYEHVQEDLIDGQPSVTCYCHEQGRCTNPACRRWARCSPSSKPRGGRGVTSFTSWLGCSPCRPTRPPAPCTRVAEACASCLHGAASASTVEPHGTCGTCCLRCRRSSVGRSAMPQSLPSHFRALSSRRLAIDGQGERARRRRLHVRRGALSPR